MEKIVSTEPELIEALRARVPTGSSHLVSVDGASGSGKTTTGAHLAEALQGRHIDLDSIVSGVHPSYLDRIDSSGLSDALAAGVKEAVPIVVSGICVLSALRRVDHIGDTRVYIKRMSGNSGMPSDVDLFDASSEWFAKLSHDPIEEGRKPYSYSQDWIDRQVGSYHRAERPLQNAHLVFKRTE